VPGGGDQRALIARLRVVIEAKDAMLRAELEVTREQFRRVELRVAELERRLGQDSSNSPAKCSRCGARLEDAERAGTWWSQVRDVKIARFVAGCHLASQPARTPPRRAYAGDVRGWQGWLTERGVDVLDAGRVHVDLRVAGQQDRGPEPSTMRRRGRRASTAIAPLMT
jgi:hypothetical protein